MPKKPFVDFRDIRSWITMEQVLQHYGVLDTFTVTKDSERIRGMVEVCQRLKHGHGLFLFTDAAAAQ